MSCLLLTDLHQTAARFSSRGYAPTIRVLFSSHSTTGPLDHVRDNVLVAIRFESFSINEPKP